MICRPGFEGVREAFERNFVERGELGAAVHVIVDGEPVVDMWGGIADPETGRRWDGDTLVVVQSCSKGVTATCGHVLIDRGELDLDRPVADYWPRFGRSGKAAITVRQVFNHQSGVAHVTPVVPPRGLYDWELMIALIEETAPFWEPGTRTGYHALTIGYLIGELVRRVTGMTVGAFFRSEIGEPLELDCWIGLPAEHEPRVARMQPWDMAAALGLSPRAYAIFTNPTHPVFRTAAAALRVPVARSAAGRAMIRRSAEDPAMAGLPARFVASTVDPRSAAFNLITNTGDYIDNGDTPEAHAAEIPAAGAVASARGLAGVYAPLSLGGAHKGVRILSEEAVARMGHPQSVTDVDACLGIRTAFTLGFSKSWPNQGEGNGLFIGDGAFGTPGRGGQLGFADPTARVAFAYVMNRHGVGTGLNERGQSLVDATYEALGSRGRTPDCWLSPVRRR